MNKILRCLAYLSFIFSTLSVSAQKRLDRPEIYLGITAGSSFGRVGFKPEVDQIMLQGLNGGLAMRYIGDKNVGFQLELNMVQKGWKEETGLYTKQLNYVEMPFLTHIYIGNKARVFFNLGPHIGYLLSEEVLKNQTTSSTQEQHIKAIQNKFNYGLSLGLGFSFNIKKQLFMLEGRANFGLSDIYSNLKRDYFDASNNMNLSVNAGWLIRVK